jgi:hypothetical protein
VQSPFAFVEEALGVGVEHVEDGAQGTGYYLVAPEPEWLGATFTAALKRAREVVADVEPSVPFDWVGAARSVVYLLDLVLPAAAGAPAAARSTDDAHSDDDLP